MTESREGGRCREKDAGGRGRVKGARWRAGRERVGMKGERGVTETWVRGRGKEKGTPQRSGREGEVGRKGCNKELGGRERLGERE